MHSYFCNYLLNGFEISFVLSLATISAANKNHLKNQQEMENTRLCKYHRLQQNAMPKIGCDISSVTKDKTQSILNRAEILLTPFSSFYHTSTLTFILIYRYHWFWAVKLNQGKSIPRCYVFHAQYHIHIFLSN